MEFLKPFAEYYFYVYLLIVVMMTVNQFHILKKTKGYAIISRQYDYRPMVVFTIFYIIFYGFRPLSEFFGDTVNYRRGYELLQNFGVFNMSGDEDASSDVIFRYFEKICAKTVDIHVWFAIIMFLLSFVET